MQLQHPIHQHQRLSKEVSKRKHEYFNFDSTFKFQNCKGTIL